MKKALIICQLILISALLTYSQKNLTNEEIWHSSKFFGKSIRGVRSMNDGLFFTTLERDGEYTSVIKFSYESYEKVETVVNSEDLIPQGNDINIGISDYTFSADESKLLISTDVEKIYRRSSRANYYIYDLQTKTLKSLSDQEKGKQRLAEFSPDGSKVAFVRDNNLFVSTLESGEEIQVTTDGMSNTIINGATDWVYEEEFGFDKGFYWSPDSKKIAFYRFDEERVREFEMLYFRDLYPEPYRFKYPKAGEKNAIVSIYVYDVAGQTTRKVDIGDEDDQYIPRIKWTPKPGDLVIFRLNRLQNHLELLLVNNSEVSGILKSEVFFSEKSDTYIADSNYDNLLFPDDGNHFIFTSDRDGFMHIYRFDMQGKIVNQITKGTFDIESVKGVDVKKGLVYYTAREESPLRRDLYVIKLNGSKKKKLSEKDGFNNALFSQGMKYYINYHSGANTPTTVTLHQSNGKQIKVLEDNSVLKDTLSEYSLSPKTFFTFKTSDNIELNGWMIKPPDFDVLKKYPVLMYVYGGPGSNTVIDSWNGTRYLWHQMMAQKGYIIVSVDNRGTGYRGRDFKNITYKQLGKYEVRDQIEAARYLGSLDYVDAGRIAIHGWSYGGYMSSLCITKGADVFAAAIAIAPVTNWRFYDTIYTERYMQTTQLNAAGYDDNSPINHVSKLKGAYLLVHGSGDDNVHYQNTMEMVSALVKEKKQFDLFIYPNKSHSIYGGTTRLHLYEKMTDFIMEHLGDATMKSYKLKSLNE